MPTDDTLEHLQEQFRHRYALEKQRLRQEILEARSPVILRLGDQVTLIHRGVRTSESVISEDYRRWKALSHVPVALHLWLSELSDRALTPEEERSLSTLARDLRERSRKGTPDERALLDAAASFAESGVCNRHVDDAELLAFGKRIEPAIRELIDRATRDELIALDRIVRSWTSEFGPEEWSSLHVLVCANHQARYKETTTLYFRRLLGEPSGEGAEREEHVLYVEGALTDDEAIDLLAVHHLDRVLGTTFLGDPRAMQRNLLGDAAERIVAELVPRPAFARSRAKC